VAPPPAQPGFAPLAPPPAATHSAAGGGFGSVELDMDGGKRKKGRKMKLSGGRSGGSMPKQGTFLQRNIGKLTGGIMVFAVMLFAIGFVKNNSSDTPSVKRVASSNASPEVAVTSAEGEASQSAIDSLIGQGNALFAEKKYLEAVEKYAAVQKLSPNNATATKMGYHACEFMVVQAMYNTLTQRSSTIAEQQEAYQLAMAKAQDAIERRGNIGEAISAVEQVIEFFPDDQPLQDALAKLEARRRGAVVASRQRKQEQHEASIGDLFSTAQNDRNRGDAMAAIQGYERVLAADPDKQTELYWKAEEEIRQIKAELSARGRETYRSGLAAMKSGDYLSARSQFRETLRLDPFNQVAQRRLDEVQAKLDQLAQKFWSEAEIYEKTNQLEMAIGRYRKVMEYSASASSPLSQKAKKRIDALMQ
jgi:tetratricopeptide (TPR) repeat protein